MYTYMVPCDNTTDFPVDQSMTFLALGLLNIKSKMAGVYMTVVEEEKEGGGGGVAGGAGGRGAEGAEAGAGQA